MEPPLERIAFGSCARQDEPQPIWESVLAARPQLFLLLGDNVYADAVHPKDFEQAYDEFSQVPGFQRLRKKVPLMATWDDHDFGTDNSSTENPLKAESQKYFLDFLGVSANSARRHQEGVYAAQIFGPPGRRVQIILLDTRYWRSALKTSTKSNGTFDRFIPEVSSSSTMLGNEQWRWLEQQLQFPAEVRLIGSSIQVLADDPSFENWSNFPKERERLFNLIRDRAPEPVLFLSGDRHFSELSVLEEAGHHRWLDLTSSSLNQSLAPGAPIGHNPTRKGDPIMTNNFGMVRFHWDFPTPELSLEIHSSTGAVLLVETHSFANLRRKN